MPDPAPPLDDADLPEEDDIKAICVPVKLDAFVFNKAIFEGQSRVAPLSKPEYGNFASASSTPRHDVVPPLDLSLSTPSTINPRLYDLVTGELRTDRFGVYLSWCIPRPFRAGFVATASGAGRQTDLTQSILPTQPSVKDSDQTSAQYIAVPNRWIIVRQLSSIATSPGVATSPGGTDASTRVFIVESDLLRSHDQFAIFEDVENEFTPFLDGSRPLHQQGNAFLGAVREGGQGLGIADKDVKRQVPLTVVGASNPLFADYQPHHAGVFSLHDDMHDVGSATVSYFLMGYYGRVSATQGPQDPMQSFGKIGQFVSDKDLLSTFKMQLQKPGSNDENHPEDIRNLKLCKWKKTGDGPAQAFTICHGALYHVEYDKEKAPEIGKWPAEIAMTALRESSPVAVGATSIDALIALMRAAADNLTNGENQKAAFALIKKVQCYLVRPSDDVDSQLEAAELLDTHNFKPAKNGTVWHLRRDTAATANTKQALPSSQTLRALAGLNNTQALLDQLERERTHLQHLLFCLYWKGLSLKAAATTLSSETVQGIQTSRQALVDRIKAINLTVNTQSPQSLAAEAKAANLEAGIAPSFYMQKDPVVAFAGLPTGWPTDWDDDVHVRFKRMSRKGRDMENPVPRRYAWQYDDVDEAKISSDLAYISGYQKLLEKAVYWDDGRHPLIEEALDAMYTDKSIAAAISRLRGYQWEFDEYFDRRNYQIVSTFDEPNERLGHRAHLYLVPQYDEMRGRLGLGLDWTPMMRAVVSALRRLQLGGIPPLATRDVLEHNTFPQVWDEISRNSNPPNRDLADYGTFVKGIQYSSDKFGNTGMDWLKTDSYDPWDLRKRLQHLPNNHDVTQKLENAVKESGNPDIEHVFKDLFLEWMCLNSGLDFGRITSHYHNVHDIWLTQAFFPIYVEWELEYYHIPFTSWTFGPSGKEKRIRYSIKSGIDLSKDPKAKDDLHIISGRSFVLPNVASQIRSMIQRLLDAVNPNDLDPAFKADDMWNVLSNLLFMSSAMTGFNDHLATLQAGLHLKPLKREQGQKPSTAAGSEAPVADLGFTEEVMALMGTATGRTPFSELNGGPLTEFSAFKPVTHGQARFSKLSIVDKFGQVVPCLDPAHRAPEDMVNHGIDPITSEYMFCEPLGPDSEGHFRPNTVLDQEAGRCEFFQIPPRINQDARWNAHYLMRQGSTWRPCSEWENPIICLLVINYMDKSLQLFHATGDFAAEYALGSKTGGAGIRLRPFAPKPVSNPQMASLMSHLAQRDYLVEVYSMIEEAVGNLPHAPGSYADALPAVLGRPIAFTYAGWSLELATPPYASHAFGDATKQVHSVEDYRFPLKLGDKDAAYDGLIGYCPIPRDSTMPTYSTIQTHFGAKTKSKHLVPASDSVSTTIQPYYIQANSSTSTPDSIAEQHNTSLTKFALFVDLFTPVNAYSGILPVKQLHLPSWTMEQILRQMTGFYAVGPLLVPDDVLPQHYGENNPLPKDFPEPEHRSVQIPHDRQADLVWMQPSYGAGPQTKGFEGGSGGDGETFYEVMGLGGIDGMLGERKGVLSAVEGYLQVKKKKMEDLEG